MIKSTWLSDRQGAVITSHTAHEAISDDETKDTLPPQRIPAAS